MKKFIVLLGLLVLGASQVYSMEPAKDEKEWEKDFRRNLAGYRGAYTLQQFLEATGQKENDCEMSLRIEYEDFLNAYKNHHQFSNRNPQRDFDKLEKFKTKEVQKFFNTCKMPIQSAVSGYSQPINGIQREFCMVLAGCRSAYALQMLLEATKQKENKAEERLHQEYKKALSKYKADNPDNVFITTNAAKLEVLKQEARAFFAQCKK